MFNGGEDKTQTAFTKKNVGDTHQLDLPCHY